MSAVIRGDPGAHLIAVNYHRDKQKGWQVAYVYEGTRGAIDSLVANNTAADSAEVDNDGLTSRATLVYGAADEISGTTEPTFDTWELLGNDLEKSNYANLNTLYLTTEEVAEVKRYVDKSGDDDTYVSPPFLHQVTAGQMIQSMLYKHLVAGYDGFLESQYVLRRTTAVSSRYTGKAAFTDTYKILTTAQLTAAEVVPATILFSLADIDANLISFPTQTSLKYDTDYTFPSGRSKTAGDNIFKYGWLKRTPTVTQQALNKFALTYEYWHAAWSTWLYDEKT